MTLFANSSVRFTWDGNRAKNRSGCQSTCSCLKCNKLRPTNRSNSSVSPTLIGGQGISRLVPLRRNVCHRSEYCSYERTETPRFEVEDVKPRFLSPSACRRRNSSSLVEAVVCVVLAGGWFDSSCGLCIRLLLFRSYSLRMFSKKSPDNVPASEKPKGRTLNWMPTL